jgi:hypothetical protein
MGCQASPTRLPSALRFSFEDDQFISFLNFKHELKARDPQIAHLFDAWCYQAGRIMSKTQFKKDGQNIVKRFQTNDPRHNSLIENYGKWKPIHFYSEHDDL